MEHLDNMEVLGDNSNYQWSAEKRRKKNHWLRTISDPLKPCSIFDISIIENLFPFIDQIFISLKKIDQIYPRQIFSAPLDSFRYFAFGFLAQAKYADKTHFFVAKEISGNFSKQFD